MTQTLQSKLFETPNRNLEQFLHCHRIPFIRQYKDENNTTYWVYAVTPQLSRVVAEYRELFRF